MKPFAKDIASWERSSNTQKSIEFFMLLVLAPFVSASLLCSPGLDSP
jgi:hypothetical protein